jgi:hypothetical protein
LLNQEGEWLLGEELGSFVVDSIVAVLQEYVPQTTPWWSWSLP